jgi:hypothetical protein
VQEIRHHGEIVLTARLNRLAAGHQGTTPAIKALAERQRSDRQ